MSKQISKIYHAAIYVRLSKEDGDVSTSAKAESNSISNQKDFIRNFLADKKDIRIVKEYVDDGYSGSNFDRPSFQTMMEDIKRGVIDCVVVKDLSRFGREYIDSGRYIERLFPALIYKLFLEGKGYTPIAKYLNEQGIMSPLMYLKSLGYQQNVKTNGVWTKTTVKSILTNQAYIGSAVHGKVVIEKYNNIPLHATDPSEWVIVENTHEPLVDKETFEKAQERVKEISDAYFAKEFTKHPPNEMNLLKGKIVCGDCGKGMRLSPRTTKSYVYFCGTFSDGINPACSRHKIDQEEVNKAVFAQISNHMRCCIDALKVIRELNARSSGLKKYDVFYYCGVCGRALVPSKRVKGDILLCYSSRIEENSPCKNNRVEVAKVEDAIMKIVNMYATAYLDEKGIKKAGKSKEVSPEEKIATLEKKVKSLSSKKMMLYSDYKDDKLTREEYVKRSKAMVEQIDELHQEIEQLKTEIPPEDNSSSKFETQLESIINMESFDREKIQKVIKKVIINGEDNIEIVWNTDDPFFK